MTYADYYNEGITMGMTSDEATTYASDMAANDAATGADSADDQTDSDDESFFQQIMNGDFSSNNFTPAATTANGAYTYNAAKGNYVQTPKAKAGSVLSTILSGLFSPAKPTPVAAPKAKDNTALYIGLVFLLLITLAVLYFIFSKKAK